ncbi:MAG TPA: MMPL family transporter [Patescibacteria group bacterium]|nr:MMPL family transporter [Patescibacteria group bacterium]
MNLFTPARSAAVAGLLAVLTLVLSLYAMSLRADPGVESLIPARGGDARRLSEFNKAFGSDETIVMALQAEPLFTKDRLAIMAELTDRAARIPHVSRVLSPTNVRDLDGDSLGPFERQPYKDVLSGRTTPAAMGSELAAHPLFGGLLVSTDARTAAVLIELARTDEGQDYRAAAVRAVRELAAGLPEGIKGYVAGMPVEKVDVAAYVEQDQRTFAPLIVAMLVLVTAALYRHPVGVIVPLMVVGASVIWTLGLYALAGRTLNPVTSLLTPVVLVVSVEGVVHLMNQHLAARAEGLHRRAALGRAIRHTWLPCFNAALTTAIGFGSLMLMPIPAIRDFGLFSAAGVMISWLLTLVLAPLLLAWLPDFPPRVTDTFRPGRLETVLKSISSWVCRHPAIAGALSLLVLAVSAAGVARIRVETDIIGSLRHGSPLYIATSFIDRNLTGVNAIEIVVKDVPVDDAAALERLATLEREVRAMPGVRKVVGLPDLFARANRAFHAGDVAFERLPSGEDAGTDLADSFELLGRSAPADLARLVSRGDGVTELRLEARVTALDTGASQQLFSRIREAASRAGLDRTELTGNFVVLSDMSTGLVYNQIGGLVPALALILAALAIQFRSPRLGLLSAIPHGAPVLMVYGLMGLIGIPLSVPTAMIANIVLGMTDDNTIHLLSSFRDKLREGVGYVQALDAMFDTSGRAVVFSTITLAMGFWVGMLSSFLPTVQFAALTGAALLFGLACETVLLPLTMIVFRPLSRYSTKPRQQAGA